MGSLATWLAAAEGVKIILVRLILSIIVIDSLGHGLAENTIVSTSSDLETSTFELFVLSVQLL